MAMYGLRVRSALPLPDWPVASPGEPEVEILRTAPSLPTFEGATYNARTTFSDGAVVIEVRGVATYSAEGGSRIRVAPEAGAKPEDVQLYLTGAMFGVILHQRGILPLHASCVGLDGRGVAFAAASGSGKSTLVAALLGRGATFVSDDICALTPVRDGEVRVWPGAPRMKLDESGLAAMQGARSGTLEPAGGNRGKYHVPVEEAPVSAAPMPLRHMYLLEWGEGEPRLERLQGLEAISALVDQTYMLSHATAIGFSERVFRGAAQVSRRLTVSRLTRPRGFDHFEAVLDLIERDV
ncbi:MAG TPA: hypothetical protein VMM83_02470 [Longimicrobiales bacterium]|nr:hypothetical protein [Longimicrobiales bacterium]